MKKSIQLAALIGAVSMFSACSDDVTEVYNGTTGMSVLGEGEKLSKQACDESNIGEMLYVTDESAAFFCNGEKWETLKGEDGKDGNTCSVKQNKDKSVTTITCETEDGEVSYDVKNGKNGKDGKDGDDGYSCSAKQNSDKTVTTITCETKDGKVSYKVRNGADGADGNDGENGSGCRVVDNGDGAINVVCGDGEGESSEMINMATCGDKAYNPMFYTCDGRDGNLYKTVEIGKQRWMAENLNLNLKLVGNGWQVMATCGGNSKSGPGDCGKYGQLYTWSQAIDSVADFSNATMFYGDGIDLAPKGKIRGICPEGWHLPSKEEWETLIKNAGGADKAGKKLKTTNTDPDDGGWYRPSSTSSELKKGSDEYGFSAIPVGMNGNVGQMTEFWSSSVDDENKADNVYFLHLNYSSDKASLNNSAEKGTYKSIRCLKD